MWLNYMVKKLSKLSSKIGKKNVFFLGFKLF